MSKTILKFDTLVRHKHYGRGHIVAFGEHFYEIVGVQFDTPTGTTETLDGYGALGYSAWVHRKDIVALFVKISA
jgi:hypothetical protein